MKTTWTVMVFGTLLSLSALAGVKVDVEYESANTKAHGSALLKDVGDSVELFGTERTQVVLKLMEQEGKTVKFQADMRDSASKDAKPVQARLITLLGEDAEIKASDDQGKLLYRLKVKPVKDESKR